MLYQGIITIIEKHIIPFCWSNGYTYSPVELEDCHYVGYDKCWLTVIKQDKGWCFSVSYGIRKKNMGVWYPDNFSVHFDGNWDEKEKMEQYHDVLVYDLAGEVMLFVKDIFEMV